MLKLYGFPLSQPTRSVLLLLKESKTPFEFVLIDALKGEHRKNAQFKADFPGNALLPSINDGGLKLGESGAILQYIAESRKLENWYPQADVAKRAHISSWMHWHHTNTRLSTKGLLHTRIFPKVPDREGILARGIKTYTLGMKHIDGALQSSQYLAGGASLSIADLLILCEVDQLLPEAFNLFDYSPYPNVLRWLGDCRKEIKAYDEVYRPVCDIAKTIPPLPTA